jgi:hypothetical protein
LQLGRLQIILLIANISETGTTRYLFLLALRKELMSSWLLKTHSRRDSGNLLLTLHYTKLLFHVVVNIYIYDIIKSLVDRVRRYSLTSLAIRKYSLFR